MGKTSYTILEEMRQAVAALRSQLDSIEDQMAALESAVNAEVADSKLVASADAASVTEAEAAVGPEEVASAVEPAEAQSESAVGPAEAQSAAGPDKEAVQDMSEKTVAETPAVDEAPADTLVMEEAPEPIDLGISDFNLGDIDMPAANINDAEAANVKPAVMDVMAEKCAWKTDMPGTPVKNVLSAISLNDRILFVKALFGEDAALFQQTIQIFNACGSLAEAEDYISTNFRHWDMNSDVVYRFMMAVRRKLK